MLVDRSRLIRRDGTGLQSRLSTEGARVSSAIEKIIKHRCCEKAILALQFLMWYLQKQSRLRWSTQDIQSCQLPLKDHHKSLVHAQTSKSLAEVLYTSNMQSAYRVWMPETSGDSMHAVWRVQFRSPRRYHFRNSSQKLCSMRGGWPHLQLEKVKHPVESHLSNNWRGKGM